MGVKFEFRKFLFKTRFVWLNLFEPSNFLDITQDNLYVMFRRVYMVVFKQIRVKYSNNFTFLLYFDSPPQRARDIFKTPLWEVIWVRWGGGEGWKVKELYKKGEGGWWEEISIVFQWCNGVRSLQIKRGRWMMGRNFSI